MNGEKAWRQLHKDAASCIERGNTLQNSSCMASSQLSRKLSKLRTRHTGHRWRSRDELINDILLWTPSRGQAKVGRPTKTYIQQLYADTGCSLGDLPGTMNNRDRWRERVREIRASSATWWWWWLYSTIPNFASALYLLKKGSLFHLMSVYFFLHKIHKIIVKK